MKKENYALLIFLISYIVIIYAIYAKNIGLASIGALIGVLSIPLWLTFKYIWK